MGNRQSRYRREGKWKINAKVKLPKGSETAHPQLEGSFVVVPLEIVTKKTCSPWWITGTWSHPSFTGDNSVSELSHPVLSALMISPQAFWHLLFFLKASVFETGQLYGNPSFHFTSTTTKTSKLWTLVVTGKSQKTWAKCCHSVQKPKGRGRTEIKLN